MWRSAAKSDDSDSESSENRNLEIEKGSFCLYKTKLKKQEEMPKNRAHALRQSTGRVV